MKKFVAYALVIGALAAAGCAKEVRYSPSELEKFPPEVQGRIKAGEVALGMTQEQVRYSWGAPSEVNVLKPVDGKMREEWVFKQIGSKTTLIFTDGRLTEIISSGISRR